MEQLVLRQLQQLPANLQQEVLDFIGYLLFKQQYLLSESAAPYRVPEKTSALSAQELAEAIRFVSKGCNMNTFGDALAYQQATRTERPIPFRD